MPILTAPFPWFGGKSRAANLIWERFGNPANYVEPFAGSLAVLLARPHEPQIETVNDKDGFICNAWRAIANDPEQTAYYADSPVNENDLHARHIWLAKRRASLARRLEGDPDYFDAKIAGWWLWGISCWIGSGWCDGKGPWQIVEDNEGVPQLVQFDNQEREAIGVPRKRVHLGNQETGVNRKRVHLHGYGQGVNRKNTALLEYFMRLAERLRNVRVCCGDWTRVLGPSVTTMNGVTAILLDPPYHGDTGRDPTIYVEDDLAISTHVREWAIANGDNPMLRIALCGYEGEHNMPSSWTVETWNASRGYHGHEARYKRERIWFSPACVQPLNLFTSLESVVNPMEQEE